MIKHKYTIVVLIILVPIFFVIQNNKWGKEKKISDRLIANGIKFSGIITDLKMSRNHEFGIIELRVIKSDTSKFLPSINERMFPYAINDSIAEAYDSVTYVLKKGDSVEVDYNEKVIKFFHKNE